MPREDSNTGSAHDRIAGILHHARMRGGWDDEAIAEHILRELSLDHDGKPVGAAQPAADDTSQAAPAAPTVYQASSLQTPIQPPNPALGPPPDDMIKGVEPNSPPEPGKHPAAPAPDEAQAGDQPAGDQPAGDQPAGDQPAGDDRDAEEDQPDERERRARGMGRRHGDQDHGRDHDHDHRERDRGKK